MSADRGTFNWSVRAADGSAHENAFDALILPTDGRHREHWPSPAQIRGGSVPYESSVTDAPLTLIVRTRRDGMGLIVHCSAYGPDGTHLMSGSGQRPVVVIVRSGTGVIVGAVPDEEDE